MTIFCKLQSKVPWIDVRFVILLRLHFFKNCSILNEVDSLFLMKCCFFCYKQFLRRYCKGERVSPGFSGAFKFDPACSNFLAGLLKELKNLNIKAHANGRNIVGQQHATLLGPTCCVRLHGTTTMLGLVGNCCV